MILERNWFMLYLPRNLKHKFLISSVPIWTTLVGQGMKRRETIHHVIGLITTSIKKAPFWLGNMTRTSFERNRKSMSDPLAVAAMSGLRLRGLTLYGRHSSRIGQTSPPYLIAKRIRAETNQIDDTVKP